MLKPQDVFLHYEQFRDWVMFVAPLPDTTIDLVQMLPGLIRSVWDENEPCVPGSYGINIT